MTGIGTSRYSSNREIRRTGHDPLSLDIRIRLLIALATSVAVLVLSHPLSLCILCLAGAAYLALLRRFKVQLVCYVALIAMAAMSVLFLHVSKSFLPMMRGTDPVQMLVPFLRMAAMLHVVLAVALSLRLRDVLGFMKDLRFPRALYLPLAVTIRFIPGMIDDVRQMRDCLRLRGYGWWSMFRPRLWLLPLVFRSLHLSDELAIAAELKGVGYGRPAHPKGKPLWNRNTRTAIALLTIVMVAAVVTDRAKPNAETGFGMSTQSHRTMSHGNHHGQQSQEEAHDRH